MKHFIFQGNNNDCGFASLKMILATLSNNDSYLYISKPSKKEGYTLKELIDIANDFNVELIGSKCDKEYLNECSYPCLALINSNHVVMLKKATKNRVKIYDPEKGIYWLTKKKFKKIWSDILLEVGEYSNIEKINVKKRTIIPTKTRFIHSLISVLSSCLLMVSLYFLNNLDNMIFTILFLILFCLSQFIENLFLYKEINYFDEKYIQLFFSKKENQSKGGYLDFLNFKRNYFVSTRGNILSILLVTSILFILLINNYKNIFVFIIILLIKLLDIIFSNKSNETVVKKVSDFETKGLDFKEQSSVNLLLANKCSNRKVFLSSIKNLLYIILCFCFSLIMMVTTNNSGCNFVLFHFMLYFVSYKSLNDLLHSLSNKKQNFKEECIFMDKID